VSINIWLRNQDQIVQELTGHLYQFMFYSFY